MTTTQPSFEIPTEMRDFAEKSVEQARTARKHLHPKRSQDH